MKKEDIVQSQVVEYILNRQQKKTKYDIGQYIARCLGLGIIVFASDTLLWLPFAASILLVGEVIGISRDL